MRVCLESGMEEGARAGEGLGWMHLGIKMLRRRMFRAGTQA